MPSASTKDQSDEERRRKQQELDSILDAALDELDDSDSDGDNDADYYGGHADNSTSDVLNGKKSRIAASLDDDDNNAMSSEAAEDSSCNNSMGNLKSQTESEASPSPPVAAAPEPKSSETKPKRPVFGPEPPPYFSKKTPTNNANSNNSNNNSNNDLNSEEADLASSLEGMMQEFLRAAGGSGGDVDGPGLEGLLGGIGAAANGGAGAGGMGNAGNESDLNGMAELENAEKALEDIFRKMMEGESSSSGDPFGGMVTPASGKKNAKSNSGTAAATNNNNNNAKSNSDKNSTKSTTNTSTSPKDETTPRKANKHKTPPTNQPTVDESIHKLLNNINQTSTTTFHDPTSMATNLANSNVDPAEFERFGEEMMSSVMKDFEKMNTSQDADTVVDGVMKQLLDKDLMYEPMKEVMVRFPKWLAEHKEGLSEEEYTR